MKTVVIPMCHSNNVIESISSFIDRDNLSFILIGDVEETKKIAVNSGVNIDGVNLIEELNEVKACTLAAKLISEGKGDIAMKGLVHTSIFLKALLRKEFGLLEDKSLVSLVSRFIIPNYHKPLFLTDAGINISPTLDQKIKIIKNAIFVANSLGIHEPKVACLSPIEVVNHKIPSTEDGFALSQMSVFGDAIVDGPLSFDISLSKEAARIKGATSVVAGDADILFAPNLDVGNALYKSFTLFGNAKVAGVVAGLKIPVVLTSRADSKEVKVDSLELALNMK
ncbi:MAG: hypothetical protein B6229_05900 [Spirochaetaceae bacterium 4572_7]|nr:MAG: hypothetical protein B6229_05900 [Spirochaetaceae bacterium 4572_7]